jgi:hypothetical protein
MQKEEWICYPCPKDKFKKASNFGDRDTCRKCGKARVRGAAPSEDRKQEDRKEEPKMERKQVTFKPGGNLPACFIIFLKYLKSTLSTDWYCAKCNDHQFRDNKFCRSCKSSKPAAPDDSNGSECVVCFANEKNTGFLHGNEVHVACCRECANALQICPICRAPVQNRVTVYF